MERAFLDLCALQSAKVAALEAETAAKQAELAEQKAILAELQDKGRGWMPPAEKAEFLQCCQEVLSFLQAEGRAA